MNDKISTEKMSGLSSTLLIPLWSKAVEYGRPDAILQDIEAVRMMRLIDYDFSTFESAKLSQPGCCGRALLIDNQTRDFIERHPDAVIVQLGAGLDARFERLGRPPVTAWYDLDLPEVINLRRVLLPENGNCYLSASLFDEDWTQTVAAHQKPVLLLLEGVLMYFSEERVKGFFAMLARRLPQATVVLDILSPFAGGKAKRHDALRNMTAEQRPEFKWGIRDVTQMENWQPGLKIRAQFYLSDVCARRYPWWLRLLYKTRWGRNNLNVRVIRIGLNGTP